MKGGGGPRAHEDGTSGVDVNDSDRAVRFLEEGGYLIAMGHRMFVWIRCKIGMPRGYPQLHLFCVGKPDGEPNVFSYDR